MSIPNKLVVITICFSACYWNFAVSRDAIKESHLTVNEAYAAVPHRRTEYSVADSSQPREISRYLYRLFEATDLMLIERINGLNGAYNDEQYQHRIDQLSSLTPPEKAKKAHLLIVAAVNEHKQYFGGKKRNVGLVSSSHKKLVKAYNYLMQSLPDTKRNQQAYFDHLCALDFI